MERHANTYGSTRNQGAFTRAAMPSDSLTKLVGGKCNDCGFIYWEHNGHLIPCPVCALARLDALLREAFEAMQEAQRRFRALNLPSYSIDKSIERIERRRAPSAE